MATLQRIDTEFYLNWLPQVGLSESGDHLYFHAGISIS